MDLLYFIDYDIEEPLPWHSTISQTRKLLPDAIFEEAFDRVLQMCVESGLLSGETQAVDSAYNKAKADVLHEQYECRYLLSCDHAYSGKLCR